MADLAVVTVSRLSACLDAQAVIADTRAETVDVSGACTRFVAFKGDGVACLIARAILVIQAGSRWATMPSEAHIAIATRRVIDTGLFALVVFADSRAGTLFVIFAEGRLVAAARGPRTCLGARPVVTDPVIEAVDIVLALGGFLASGRHSPAGLPAPAIGVFETNAAAPGAT